MSEQVERLEWVWCCHASWRCLGIGVRRSVQSDGYPLQYNSVTDNRDA